MTDSNQTSPVPGALRLPLDSRSGWPPDLRVLLERYPREVWPMHANLGEMARFWLSRHDMFRELGGTLQTAAQTVRSGAGTPADFAAWFAPRLQFFLSQLHLHHQIEEFHYFPLFRAADARLKPGFDVLESDHETLHVAIGQVIETANDLLRRLDGIADARSAGDRYAEAGDRLIHQLVRHLDDEEDLIVPLILDRGERALGVG